MGGYTPYYPASAATVTTAQTPNQAPCRYLQRVPALLATLDSIFAIARAAFLGTAIVAGGLCAIDWAVRTRRLNPFSGLARTSRRLSAPFIGHVERRVVKAGGNPVSAPWWALGAVIVTGILVLTALDFARAQTLAVYAALDAGTRGVIRLVIRWGFFAMYIAIVVRVVSSWFRLNPFGRVVRWATAMTEPLLRPIRNVLPSFGMIDLSPLVLYLALRLLESMILRLL